mmetsp:Transcript_5761/g.14818  ORF Transcript_5761/g.14818 Transcript_5761/m.14818 type:complete len:290 (+) Transcript_5761:555-1424(+)
MPPTAVDTMSRPTEAASSMAIPKASVRERFRKMSPCSSILMISSWGRLPSNSTWPPICSFSTTWSSSLFLGPSPTMRNRTVGSRVQTLPMICASRSTPRRYTRRDTTTTVFCRPRGGASRAASFPFGEKMAVWTAFGMTKTLSGEMDALRTVFSLETLDTHIRAPTFTQLSFSSLFMRMLDMSAKPWREWSVNTVLIFMLWACHRHSMARVEKAWWQWTRSTCSRSATTLKSLMVPWMVGSDVPLYIGILGTWYTLRPPLRYLTPLLFPYILVSTVTLCPRSMRLCARL